MMGRGQDDWVTPRTLGAEGAFLRGIGAQITFLAHPAATLAWRQLTKLWLYYMWFLAGSKLRKVGLGMGNAA